MALQPSADTPNQSGQLLETSELSTAWLLIQALAGPSSGDVAAPVCLMADVDIRSWQMKAPQDFGFKFCEASSEAELTDVVNKLLGTEPVVLIPPWGRAPGELTERQEAIALKCPARPGSHGLTLVLPASSLVSQRGEKFRRRFFETWEPTAIAFITGGLLGIHPSFRTAAVQLAPRRTEERLLRMFEAPLGWVKNVDEVIADMRRLLRMAGGNTAFGYVVRQQPEPGIRLGFRDLDPRTANRRDGLRNYGDSTTLGALFEISRSRLRPNDHVHDTHDKAIRVISGRDIRSDGSISAPGPDTRWAQNSVHRLAPGDVVMRAFRTPTVRSGLVWAKVSDDELPATADGPVLTLRPEHSLSPTAEAFVLEYLRSPLAVELAGDQSGVRLDERALAALPVPLPDHDMEAAMAAVHHALNRADEWRQEALNLLDSVFDDPSAAASRVRIITESRMLRSRIEAAEALDDFGHRVRTLYPHPIALRWRRIEAESASDNAASAGHYGEILQAAEVLLGYLANVALALARECKLPVGAVTTLRENLDRGRGPGLGDWVAVLASIFRPR